MQLQKIQQVCVMLFVKISLLHFNICHGKKCHRPTIDRCIVCKYNYMHTVPGASGQGIGISLNREPWTSRTREK